MDVNGGSDEDSGRKEKSWRESLRKYIYLHEQNVNRNMNVKGHFDEVSDSNEENVIENWKKGDPYYKVAKNFELCQSVSWKVKLASNKIGYLAEEISKQNV